MAGGRGNEGVAICMKGAWRVKMSMTLDEIKVSKVQGSVVHNLLIVWDIRELLNERKYYHRERCYASWWATMWTWQYNGQLSATLLCEYDYIDTCNEDKASDWEIICDCNSQQERTRPEYFNLLVWSFSPLMKRQQDVIPSNSVDLLNVDIVT